jgi:hypothetical protein
MRAGDQEWAYGIPDHPALDLVTGPEPGPARMFTLFLGQPRTALWRGLPRLLFLRGADGAWKPMGRYRPWLDTHGPIEGLEALGAGTFLALSRDWFRDGERASPCARYALDAGGDLAFQGLVNPRVDAPLPGGRPGARGVDPAWSPWREGARLVQEGRILLLVAESREEAALLDPRDGRPLRVLALPRAPGGGRLIGVEFLTLPDGRLYCTGARAADARDMTRSPGGELAAERVGLPSHSNEVVPVAFRLDPGAGGWKPEPLPPEAAGTVDREEFPFHGRFSVVPSGRVEYRLSVR